MTVPALSPFVPTQRPVAERASRSQEERDFARALDEAEARDDPFEAEAADAEEETSEAEGSDSDAAPAMSGAFSAAAPLPAIPAATSSLLAAASSIVVAAPPASELDAAATPVEPADAPAQAAPQPDGSGTAAPPLSSDAAAAIGAATGGASSGAAEPAQEVVEGEPKERPFAERAAEGDAEGEPSMWTPPAVAKHPVGKPAVAPTMGDSQPTKADGDALAAVKVLRQAAPEAPPAEARSGATPAQAPQPGAAQPTASAAPSASFEARMQAADGSAPAQPAAAPRQAAAAAPAAQVAIHLARAVEDGVRRLEVRLNPAELGRVEVKLDVAQDGRVIAVVSAERQETLDLLQRDARSLERGLQDAGIRADSGSLNFTLRQQDRQAWSGGGSAEGRFGSAGRGSASPEPAAAVASRPRAALRALDISV